MSFVCKILAKFRLSAILLDDSFDEGRGDIEKNMDVFYFSWIHLVLCLSRIQFAGGKKLQTIFFFAINKKFLLILLLRTI